MTNIFLFQLNKIFDEPLPNMSKFDHIPRWAPDQARWYDGVGQGHGRQSKTRLGAATAVYSLLGNPRPPIGLYNTIYTIYYIYIYIIYTMCIYILYIEDSYGLIGFWWIPESAICWWIIARIVQPPLGWIHWPLCSDCRREPGPKSPEPAVDWPLLKTWTSPDQSAS